MKTLVTVLAVLIVLAGCSMFSKDKPGSNVAGPDVKDVRLSTDFKREGIRVSYTLFGSVDKVEAFGYADAWRGEPDIVAELDAKDKLVKFLRGESVSTTRKQDVIAKSLERAEDKRVDNTRPLAFDAVELESNAAGTTRARDTSVQNAHNVTSTITVTSSGRLNGVYKERSEVINDGKVYMAVWVWTPKMHDAMKTITGKMDGK